jgi:hypothetical protein
MPARSVLLSACLIAVCACAARAEPAASNFDETVAPVLVRRCLECHSGLEPAGKLDLSRRETMLAGGESGPAIVPANAEKSLLWQRVAAGEMPLKKPLLSPSEKEVLRQWIIGGAAWGQGPLDLFRFTSERRAGYDWWALQPLAQVSPSEIGDYGGAANGIDLFIVQKLRESGLRPSPPADRRTLIRRLSFDLLGLPPAPGDVAAFLADTRPDAYERLVDRLLASPDYGVRWGRHWLDAVRFGESQGFERDRIRENAWPYRDWVIDALNADMPYREFAQWQIAGDVLRPDDKHAVVATGFLVAGPYDEVGKQQQSAAMKLVVRQDELEDLVSVVGQTFLGLTVNCARCHDHKFDPIRQREYYQLCSALDGVQHGTRDLSEPAVREQARKLDQEIAALQKTLRELEAKKPPDEGGRREELKHQIAAQSDERAKLNVFTTYAVTPQTPGVTHVLLRGNPASLGNSVTPGGAATRTDQPADFGLPADAPDAARRTRLADWITDQQQPLFARVMVNRLWHHHFGAGLVDTPNDFGFNGGRPSHPELLDYLSGELIRDGWRLKSLHRRIVTSATYRQSSRYDEQAAAVDAGNRLLWRKSPTRLEAEPLRDSMLTVAGQHNPQMGGPGYRDFTTFVRNSQFYEMLDPLGYQHQRRTVYRTWIRSARSGLLDVFDCPDPSTKTPRRAVTVTPLQALALSNNSFVLRMSEQFAQRLRREAGDAAARQVRRAYALCYARDPDESELAALVPFATEHGPAELCRVLLNSNEFLYVD